MNDNMILLIKIYNQRIKYYFNLSERVYCLEFYDSWFF